MKQIGKYYIWDHHKFFGPYITEKEAKECCPLIDSSSDERLILLCTGLASKVFRFEP